MIENISKLKYIFLTLMPFVVTAQTYGVDELTKDLRDTLSPFTLVLYEVEDLRSPFLCGVEEFVIAIEAEDLGFKEFPMEVCKFENLQSINLSLNEIVLINLDLGFLKMLRDVNLSHNMINSFTLYGPVNIETLILSDNKISSTLDLSEYKNLNNLDVSHNDISDIILPIENDIKDLSLSYTNLKEEQIVRILRSVMGLEGIGLGACKLTPEILSSINWTLIRRLELNGVSGLGIFDVLNNPNLSNIEDLSISGNKLNANDLDGLIFPKMKVLNISSNSFKDFPCVKFGDGLEHIYMKRNEITFPPLQLLKYPNLIINCDRVLMEKADEILSSKYSKRFIWTNPRYLNMP